MIQTGLGEARVNPRTHADFRAIFPVPELRQPLASFHMFEGIQCFYGAQRYRRLTVLTPPWSRHTIYLKKVLHG